MHIINMGSLYKQADRQKSLCKQAIMDWIKDKEGKVVPVPFLTEHHTMQVYWESGCTVPLIL